VTPALWSSGFRPFFLLGAAYGPIALAAWMLAWAGVLSLGAGYAPLYLWHAHEMLFGFSAAFICGFVLTALPSWAGTPEITGDRLMLLVAVWSAGRIASWCSPWLWPGAVAALDLTLFPLLAVLILPGLLRAPRKRYLALLFILAALTVANAAYHAALLRDDMAQAEHALLMALNVLIVLFAMVAGFLVPVFTETGLREVGKADAIGFRWPLEAAAIASAILFAASAWPGVPAWLSGTIGCLAAATHLARLLRWRTLAIVSLPLVLAMHVGYAWLVAAMALRGLAQLLGAVPHDAWVHAFSVGALGLMKLTLLDRVVLRHTGRTLAISRTALIGLGLMLVAGLARLGASLLGGGVELMTISAIAWAAPFVMFLATDAPKLWRPSLPR
jgi:uncharacterized protein involved in response to NO